MLCDPLPAMMPLPRLWAAQAGLTTSLARIVHSSVRAGVTRRRNAARERAPFVAHGGRDRNREPELLFHTMRLELSPYTDMINCIFYRINIVDINALFVHHKLHDRE